MNKEITIKEALDIWAANTEVIDDHLSEARLFELAQPEGLLNAQKQELHHLSLCPDCIGKWKTFCDMVDDEKETVWSDSGKGPVYMGAGLLQAASSRIKQPVFIKSECRQFTVSLFPEIEQPGNAMIVFESSGDNNELEGKTADIKDAQGRTLLCATIRQGRAATKTTELERLDLSRISIVISDTSDRDSHG